MSTPSAQSTRMFRIINLSGGSVDFHELEHDFKVKNIIHNSSTKVDRDVPWVTSDSEFEKKRFEIAVPNKPTWYIFQNQNNIRATQNPNKADWKDAQFIEGRSGTTGWKDLVVLANGSLVLVNRPN